MKKRMLLLGVLLGIALLLGGCAGGGGHSVSLTDAQMAYSAIFLMAFDALSVSMGGGTNVTLINTAAELKIRNATSSLLYDRAPKLTTAPYVETITMTGYLETGTSSTMNGTVVTNSDGATPSTSSTVYNVTLSSIMTKVTSVTGTTTSSGGTNSGTLYFNGDGYTLTELGF